MTAGSYDHLAPLILQLFKSVGKGEVHEKKSASSIRDVFPLLAMIISCAPKTSSPALASGKSNLISGGSDSGGGDPLANQYIQILRFLQIVQKNEPIPKVAIAPETVSEFTDQLEKSLEGHNPKLVFPPGRTTRCFGIDKLGCARDGRIFIAREGWLEADLPTKIQVASMELMMSLGLKERYDTAARISAVLSPRLILVDGNVRIPRSTDSAGLAALKILNQKKNTLRRQILKARADRCFELSGECNTVQTAADSNHYLFSAVDLVGIVHEGVTQYEDPCKSEKCDGTETTTHSYIIIIKIKNRARWGGGDGSVSLKLTTVQEMKQSDGSLEIFNKLEFDKGL